MFKGEKTAIFWLGLVVFGYAIYNFFESGWQTYLNYDVRTEFGLVYNLRFMLPSLVMGLIFLSIGLTIMRAGIRKDKPEA